MAKKTYTRPEGRTPRANETCPLCAAAPNTTHAQDCPWLLWAKSPRKDPSAPILRSRGFPQMPYGFVARSNWGEGDARAEFAVGDVVYVPEGCAAVLDNRCLPGLHRVESCFSIGEDASFYYRLSPAAIIGEKGSIRIVTNWFDCSDRLHVIPGRADYTLGWSRLYSAEEQV